MSRYSGYLGRAVDVLYRAGDICLPASGMFVGDSGRSVFLEQHFEQHGQLKNFRWEIPYACIVRLEQSEMPADSAAVREEDSVPCEPVPAAVSRSSEDSSQPLLASRAKTA